MVKIGVIGYGYVGKAIANRLSKFYNVVCYECNPKKIEVDITNESLLLTDQDIFLTGCNYFIITVQTPIQPDGTPNLEFLIKGTEIVSKYLTKGGIVVYESTVYPGVTENICGRLLENLSGLTLNKDFSLAYSPERISPGEEDHRIENIAKIVSASNNTALEQIKIIYSKITNKDLYCCSSIMEAEAAKLLENLQRDVNIALVNEYTLVMQKIGVDINNVIAAAKTKWNFNCYFPGFVGGHCIGIDTHYYIKIANDVGIIPNMALTSRETNEKMIFRIVDLAQKALKNHRGQKTICILGISYKANIDDTRNSASLKIAEQLIKSGANVLLFDPLVSQCKTTPNEFELCEYEEIKDIDLLICLVYHDIFNNYKFLKSFFNNPENAIVIDPHKKISDLRDCNIFSL